MERQWWKGRVKDTDVHLIQCDGEEGRCGLTTYRRIDEKWEMVQLLVVSIMWEEEIKAEET